MKIARIIVFVLLTVTVGRIPLEAQCGQLLEDLRKGEITQNFQLGDCPRDSLSKELQEEIETLTIGYLSNGNAEKIEALAKLELEIYNAYKSGPMGYNSARVAREMVEIVNSEPVQILLRSLDVERDWEVVGRSREDSMGRVAETLSLAAELMPKKPSPPAPHPGEFDLQKLEKIIGHLLDERLEEKPTDVVEEKRSLSLTSLKKSLNFLALVTAFAAPLAVFSFAAVFYLAWELKKRLSEGAGAKFVKTTKFREYHLSGLNRMAEEISSGQFQHAESLGRSVLENLEQIPTITRDVQKIKEDILDLRSPAGGQETAEKRESIEVVSSEVFPVSEAGGTMSGSAPAAELESLDAKIRKISNRLRTLEEKPPVAIPVPRVQPQPPTLSKKSIREASGEAVGDFEFEVLKFGWQKYVEQYDTEGELARFLEKDSEWGGRRDILLLELQPAVCNHDELRAPYEDILTPVKDFDKIVSKLSNIEKLVRGSLPRLRDPAKDLLRTRGFSSLLSQLQNSTGGSGLPRLDLRRWVSERFCGFADLFLRVFQKSRLNGDASLESGYDAVRKVLSWADLKPLDIEFDETRLDGSGHVGQGPEV